LRLNAHALHRRIDLGSATMDDHGMHPDAFEQDHVTRERMAQGLVGHGMATVLDHHGFIGKLLEIGQGLNQHMGLLHVLGHVHGVWFPHNSTAIRQSETTRKSWLVQRGRNRCAVLSAAWPGKNNVFPRDCVGGGRPV
jgi:hypothetical protein